MDVEAYLERLRYPGPPAASESTLRGLHIAHVFAVPFENLDIHLGRTISLDLEAIFRKVVTGRRGGYCFELNGLFAWLLESIGFTVSHLMARVLWGASSVGPRSHRVVLVGLADRRWIVDVGFGGNGLIAPIPLEPNHSSAQYAETFRLMEASADDYRLDCRVGDAWEPLYSFTLDRHLPVDYTFANYYHSHAPDSIFVRKRLCTKPTPEGRLILQDRRLKIRPQGRSREHTIETAKEYGEVLARQFGIELPEADIQSCFAAAKAADPDHP